MGAALVLGLRWLTGGGAPVPTALAVPTVPGNATSSSSSPSTSASASAAVGLPDHQRTPGAINAAVTPEDTGATICKAGWAATVRPPAAYTSALKIAQIIEYGYADRDPRHYQEDHLVPLELGGAPRDRRNLWPQPNDAVLADGTKVGSTQKDDLEDVLHSRVCGGTLSLSDAQRMIAGDWIAAWTAAGRP